MLYTFKNKGIKYNTKEDVKEIALDLKYSAETIRRIDFSQNVFKLEAMSEICTFISQIKKLEAVNLDGIFSTLPKDEMLSCLIKISVALQDKKLVEIDCSNNALSSELPDEFINLLSKCNTLKTLKIRNCGLGKKGANVIGKCLSNLAEKNNLEYLDLAQNRFFSFPDELRDGLTTLKNLRVLKLEYNTIEKTSMTEALKALRDHPFEILDIRDNFLNIEGCRVLGEIFAQCNVRELYMGDCLAHSEGILEFLQTANGRFVSMTLPGDFEEGTEYVLDISYNDWEQECIEEIIKFCKKYSIKKLYITGNLYDDESELLDAVSQYGGQLVCCDSEEEEIREEEDEVLIEMIGKI